MGVRAGRVGLVVDARRNRTNRDESGFTIVELIIALALMAIVMASLAPAFDGALQAAATGNHRATADGLTTAAVEQMRAVPYYQVGYTCATLSGGTCTTPGGSNPNPSFCTGSNPVYVDSGYTSALPAGGLTTQTVDNITYTVHSCVYWADSSLGAGTYTGAYKQSVATAQWSDSAGSHTLTNRSAVYPGGQSWSASDNNYSPNTTTTTSAMGTPSAPINASAVDGPTGSDTTITVSWNPPTSTGTTIAYYRVEYNTTGVFGGPGTFGTSPEVNAGSTPAPSYSWSQSVFSPGTTYYFEVVAYSATNTASSASNLASATTTGSSGGCTVSSLSVSPTSAMVDKNGQLVGISGFSLAVNATSGCNPVNVQYTDGSGTQYAPVSGSSGQMNGTTLSSSTTWNVGTDYFTVWAKGSQYSPMTQVLVNICRENGNSGHC